MRYTRRDAVRADLPRIVEIYNAAVATRESSCDLEPVTVASRERWFETHAVTMSASNQSSIGLFERHGFERWGLMPRVARLETVERGLVMMGRRLAEA